MEHHNNWMEAISHWLPALLLFLLIVLGWLGDSLLSMVLRRPLLSFPELYGDWKRHHLAHVALSKIR